MSSGARAIDSPQNARAKKWLALTESRGIRKHGEFILSGRKTVPEALEILHSTGGLAPRVRGLVRMGQRRWDLVLDRGQIIEQGSHTELLAQGGYYAELERVQREGGEEEDLQNLRQRWS